MKDDVRAVEGKRDVTRCPYCHEGCATEEATTCPSCQAPHHADCWTAGRGCGACAIGERSPVGTPVPAVAARAPAAPPPLTLDVVRETLVRAGYGLGQVDEVLGARREASRGWGGAFQVILALVALVAGGSAGAWVMESQRYESMQSPAAAAAVVAAFALLLALRRR